MADGKNQMEEIKTIELLRKGDEETFEALFNKHFKGLCLYAGNILKNSAAAEEIVEDFFCYLWDHCESLMINTSINGYLYTSIHNRCLKYLRHQKVKQNYIEESQFHFADKELLNTVSADYPEANLISKELEEKISSAIGSLPEQCKKVFCLNRFENLTYQEIAGQVGVSVNTVKTQMTTALKKLREELKEYL